MVQWRLRMSLLQILNIDKLFFIQYLITETGAVQVLQKKNSAPMSVGALKSFKGFADY